VHFIGFYPFDFRQNSKSSVDSKKLLETLIGFDIIARHLFEISTDPTRCRTGVLFGSASISIFSNKPPWEGWNK
jgi:hypothetical protein